jgi:hypothetical protein
MRRPVRATGVVRIARRQRYAQAMKRTTGRISFAGERRASEVSRAGLIHLRSPVYGAMSAGVRQRRLLVPREFDVSARIRRTVEARRGGSTGPTFWRT